MMKANGNGRKWIIGAIVTLLLAGMVARMERIDNRQTMARVRNLENIAVNASILASHGERVKGVEECMKHVRRDLDRMDKKLDILIGAAK